MPSDPRRSVALPLAGAALSGLLVAAAPVAGGPVKPASPIYGVTVPDGYRDWRLIAPALEDAPLDELRAVLGNDLAVKAYRDGTLPFPDGAILVKLAWKRTRSAEFEPATVPGRATTVQVMVKDSGRYPQSGGWGFGRFIDGAPVDEAQHETCFACHEARVRNHDFVFTRYAR
ncbi:cytochrome C oxidase subunit III [Methylobacterium tarhaniae]|uniref:Cytochrome C oxidase subunit III n=1 Tax=Methylobacterium tarhaniae TaxID=1187852 RepID=A0A0J6TCH0_9HYPH|nr:cytochrome P460 family protein [Methylobacterium tarhaniae]KMO43539.1 cytochrome C oxidase subunit III [Methylobacterium tarhaniae]